MAIYIKQGATLTEMTEQPYGGEEVLQQPLVDPPNLLVRTPSPAAASRPSQRFERESRLAASIDHPNVIPIYEADEEREVLPDGEPQERPANPFSRAG